MAKALIRQLPFDLTALGGSVLVSQGWGGSTSHYNYMYYALDFKVGYNTKLYAMADGVVVDLRENVPDGGSGASTPRDEGPSRIGNFVTIYYASLGLYATYQHLKTDGVAPIKGATVHTGDLLGYTGNTGYRTATHFHLTLGLNKITFNNGGSPDKSTWSIVADGSLSLGTPATFDTATGKIEAGIVAQVSYDLGSSSLGADQHNLTLLGSKAINGTGDSSGNIISGTSGNNVLDGKGGNDFIYGGGGRDTIIGGAGADQLYGGADSDTFVFKALTDSGLTSSTRDSIKDFSVGDYIDLSAIDANTLKSGDQAFTWVGTKALKNAGDLHFANGYLEGDVNGDGKADFQIELSGVSSISSSYIIP